MEKLEAKILFCVSSNNAAAAKTLVAAAFSCELTRLAV